MWPLCTPRLGTALTMGTRLKTHQNNTILIIYNGNYKLSVCGHVISIRMPSKIDARPPMDHIYFIIFMMPKAETRLAGPVPMKSAEVPLTYFDMVHLSSVLHEYSRNWCSRKISSE